MPSNKPLTSSGQILEVISEIARHIHPGLELDQLLQNAVETVRALLQTDRVVIYQFLADGDGLVAVEAVQPPWRSVLGELIYDPCFATGWAEQYQQGRINAIADIHRADLEDCFVELMVRLQVRAKLVVPVLCEGQLWGLLIAHHCASERDWQPLDITLMQQVALQLGMAISQKQLRSQLHQNQRRLETELAQRTEALRTSQHRWRDMATVLNYANAAISQIRVYADGRRVLDYQSDGCEQVFGFTAQELLDSPQNLWSSRVHPEDWQRVILPSLAQVQAEAAFTLEYRFYHKDGSLRWILDNLVSRRCDQEDCWQITAVGTDITDRKRIEADLRHHRDLFQQVVNNIEQYLFVRDLETGELVYASPAYEQIWQRPLAELYANPDAWMEAVLPEDLPQVMSSFAAQQQGQAVTRSYRISRPSGEIRWIRAQVFPILNAAGRLVRYVGWAEDCTEHQQLQMQAQAARSQLNTILDTAIAAVSYSRVYADGRYEVDYRSHGCAAIFGFTAEEFQQNPELWRSRMLPEDQARLLSELLPSVLAGENITLEYRFRDRDGSLRWIVDTFTSRRDAAADCWRVTAFAIDTTVQKAAELALYQRIAQEQLLRRITTHIRNSLDLDTILATAVQEVHDLLQADRTLVFRLLSTGDGVVIQECVQPAYPVTQAMRFVDEWFSEDCYEYYLQGQARIVPDVAQDEWASCIAEFMQSVGVKSKVVAPIIEPDEANGGSVWGLLIVHACAEYRQWQASEAELLQQIADQLAVSIQQSELYQQIQLLNRELARQSITDALTQLANRRRFDAYLHQEWQRLLRDQLPLTLVLCDVDYFKGYNDTYGHAQGDQCLTKIAQTLQASVQRPADLVARYGGEEFVMILPGTDSQGGLQVVQSMQQRLEQLQIPHAASPVSPHVTLSYGIASCVPQADSSPERLLKQADLALYQAKNAGRDRYCLFSPDASAPE